MSQKKRLLQKKKTIWRNCNRKLSKFGERHKFTDSRNSENWKHDKLKENYTETHYNQILKSKDKILKEAREKQENSDLDDFSSETMELKAPEQHFLKSGRKRLSTQISLWSKNMPEEWRYFQIKKKSFTTSRPSLK